MSEEGKKQYICVAFDNCGLIESWKRIREFSLGLKKEGKDLSYTFFISAVKLLSQDNRFKYDGPGKPRAGQSNIGFGGSRSEVGERVRQINMANDEGHEIASHAVGHFFADKLNWGAAEWSTEFWYFTDILNKVAQNHGLSGGLKFDPKQMKGFRAPYLQESRDLYGVMSKYGMNYDTSDIVMDPGTWPKQFRYSNVWNFGLPLINHPLGKTGVNRTGKTIPMDWNWFFFDVENRTYSSGPLSGQLMPESNSYKREQQKQGMLDAYFSYFESNYSHPDRPPIHIGHHFKPYNHGIYWEALKEFILGVIDEPDVEFITYSRLTEICEQRKQKKTAVIQPPAESVKEEMIKLASMDGPMGCGCDCA